MPHHVRPGNKTAPIRTRRLNAPRKKHTASHISVPAPVCAPPNNHSVWFTKGTQSIKRAAPTQNPHVPSHVETMPRTTTPIVCTCAKPPTALTVVRDKHIAPVVIGRWSYV